MTVLGATTMPRFLRCRDWQIILCTTGGMQAPQHRRPVGRGFGTDYRVEQESAKHPPKFTGRILPHREEKVKWAYPGLSGRHLLNTPGWQRAPRNTQRVVLLVGPEDPTRADCQSALQKRIPSCGRLAAPGSAPLSLAGAICRLPLRRPPRCGYRQNNLLICKQPAHRNPARGHAVG